MGISLLTALAIKNNPDIYVEAGKGKNGKWAGFISCIDAKERPRLLVSTEPIYKNSKLAQQAMNDVIADIKVNKEIP